MNNVEAGVVDVDGVVDHRHQEEEQLLVVQPNIDDKDDKMKKKVEDIERCLSGNSAGLIDLWKLREYALTDGGLVNGAFALRFRSLSSQ